MALSLSRVCADSGCVTILSRYNPNRWCALHERPTPDLVPFREIRHPAVDLRPTLQAKASPLNGRTTCDEPIPFMRSRRLAPPRGDVAFAAELAARALVLAEQVQDEKERPRPEAGGMSPSI